MTDGDKFQLCIQQCGNIERLLESQYGARGAGLHGKFNSVQHMFDAGVERRIRFIASIRNKLAHGGSVEFDKYDEYLDACNEVIKAIDARHKKSAESALNRIGRILSQRYSAHQSNIEDRYRYVSAQIPCDLDSNIRCIFAISKMDSLVGFEDFTACQDFINETVTRFSEYQPEVHEVIEPTTDEKREPKLPQRVKRFDYPAIVFVFILVAVGAGYSGFSLGMSHYDSVAMAAKRGAEDSEAKLKQLSSLLAKASSDAEATRVDMVAKDAELNRLKNELAAAKKEFEPSARTVSVTKDKNKSFKSNPATAKQAQVDEAIVQPDPTASAPSVAKVSFTVTGEELERSKGSLDTAKRELDENFFEAVRKNTRITIGKPEIRDNGKTVDLVVPVSWALQGNSPIHTLKKFMEFNKGGSFISSDVIFGPKYQNTGDRAKTVNAEQLFNYISGKKLVLVVTAAGFSGNLTIAKRVDSGSFDTGYHYIPVSSSRTNKIGHEEKNPVVIASIPKEKATDISDVSARIDVR